MKKKLILLPLLGLFLVGCTKTPPATSDSSPSDDIPTIPVSDGSEDTSEELDLTTIAQLRDTPLNDEGTVENAIECWTKGVLTKKYRGAKIDDAAAYVLTIQDGDEAIGIYGVSPDDIDSFGEIGDELTIHGYYKPYKGLHQLSDAEVVSKKAGTPVEPEVLTSVAQEDLVGKDSKLVKIPGANFVSGTITPGSASNMTIALNEVNLGGYAHYYLPVEDMQALADKLAAVDEDGIDSMDTLTFTGIIGMNNGTYQFMITHADEFTELTDGGEPGAIEHETLFAFHERLAAGTVSLGDLVHVKGVITSTTHNSQWSNNNVTIQQTEGEEVRALYLYRVADAVLGEAKVGDEVSLSGTFGDYKGMKQLTGVENLTVLGDGAAQGALSITAENVATLGVKDQNVLVNVLGLNPVTQISVTPEATPTLTFKFVADPEKTINLRENADIADLAAINAKLNGLKPVDTVDFKHPTVLGWYNIPQLVVHHSDAITVTPGEVPNLTGLELTIDGDVEVGGTKQLTVAPVPATANLPDELTYTSDAEEVATVNATGLVSGIAVGTANITVTGGGFEDTIPVNVVAPVEAKHEVTAELLGLVATYQDGTAEIGTVSWSYVQLYLSSNGEIQCRTKDGVSGSLANTTELPSAVKRVELHWAGGRYQGQMDISAGNTTAYEQGTQQIGDGAKYNDPHSAMTTEYAETDNVRFVKIDKVNTGYTNYILKIVIVLY